MDMAKNEVDNVGTGIVRFTLGGSAGGALARAAEVQSADEKKVESIYAVVFKDTQAGVGAHETDQDPLYRCVEAKVVPGKGTTPTYEFEVGESGHFWFCFVANPGTDLIQSLQTMQIGTCTTCGFKALLESQAPDTKPMLMISDFKKVEVTNKPVTNINTVDLERVMARIDIVNQADGVTV
ncbi:hypothetical protein EVA_07930, partial [gut metagenome]